MNSDYAHINPGTHTDSGHVGFLISSVQPLPSIHSLNVCTVFFSFGWSETVHCKFQSKLYDTKKRTFQFFKFIHRRDDVVPCSFFFFFLRWRDWECRLLMRAEWKSLMVSLDSELTRTIFFPTLSSMFLNVANNCAQFCKCWLFYLLFHPVFIPLFLFTMHPIFCCSSEHQWLCWLCCLLETLVKDIFIK